MQHKVTNNSIVDTLQQDNVMNMFKEQRFKFKIIVSLRCILYNNNENQLKYWHASPGVDTVFEKPKLISDRKDVESFIETFSNQDFIELVTLNRENTSWTMHCLTNITVLDVQSWCLHTSRTISPSYLWIQIHVVTLY